MSFFRDTRHLWILLVLVALVGWGALTVRGMMVPESFGRQGPYRDTALDEIASRPSVLQTDSVCHECHEDIQEERAESRHVTVRCVHCHGRATEHVILARQAESSDGEVTPAAEWDGNFLTDQDLYIARNRKVCLVCHEQAVGMPEDFQKIIVAEHLEEQGASEPESIETCFECHGPHDTAP
ncbi:MAG: hypothetical protein KDA60_00455 [Planctomycetales bacterium]|nr:hypothetical protein [Planctomycetales bacterium]